jgi:hypothetical protein
MDPADVTHREVTRREFARQAASFERAGSIFRATDILEWIGANVPVTPADSVLDVPAGRASSRATWRGLPRSPSWST